jgi:DNA-binding IclR family transcriptional regulator
METIDKALQLLKHLAEKPLSVTEAAELLDIHKSSASRMLATLQKQGFVMLNSQRRFEIGLAVFQLAEATTEWQNLKRTAEPYLQRLNRELDETIHLSVLEGVEVIYIDKIDSSRRIRMHSTVGAANPAYCTGVGKVLLAFQSPQEQRRLLGAIRFEPYTAATITDTSRLEQELREIRQSGIAFDFGEHDELIHCIAAPIFNHTRKVIASVSISAPQFVTPAEKLRSYQEILLQTVREISGRMGYPGRH